MSSLLHCGQHTEQQNCFNNHSDSSTASGANYSLCEARIFFSLSGMEGGFIQPPQTSPSNGPDMYPSTNKATPN